MRLPPKLACDKFDAWLTTGYESNMPLPSRFLLYIHARKSAVDRYSGMILVSSVNEQGAYRITIAPLTADIFTVKYCPGDPLPANIHIPGINAPVHGWNNTIVHKRMHDWSAIFQAEDGSGNDIPVIGMSPVRNVFSQYVRRNVGFILNAPVPPTIPAPAIPSPITIRHRKVGVHELPKLNPFVAKQLMDLAILRKETCPITVDEFSPSNTAVMPCGHLFVNLAIEESFKVALNKCPVCRAPGLPVFP